VTEEKMKGWKVIGRENRTSYLWGLGEAKRLYPIGMKITPAENSGPLAVFRTRKAARTFLARDTTPECRYGKIVRCEYARSEERELWHPTLYGNTLHKTGQRHLPSGTVFASSVTCLE
jgi:hypothetical protein